MLPFCFLAHDLQFTCCRTHKRSYIIIAWHKCRSHDFILKPLCDLDIPQANIFMTLIIHQPDSCNDLSAFELLWLDFIYQQTVCTQNGEELDGGCGNSEKGIWKIIFLDFYVGSSILLNSSILFFNSEIYCLIISCKNI